MKIVETPLEDCLVIESPVHGDDRGFFMESFNYEKLSRHAIDFEVKQINVAKSQKNVFRGLHFQLEPYAQTKIVGVLAGAVIDFVVDLRKNSSTYLKSFKMTLDKPGTMMIVPKGFAHGYYTLEDDTLFHYAVDQLYNQKSERGLRYNDPYLDLKIEFDKMIVSDKDLSAPLISTMNGNHEW